MTDYEIQVNFENCKSGSIMLLEKRVAFQNAIICLSASALRNKDNFELLSSESGRILRIGFLNWLTISLKLQLIST